MPVTPDPIRASAEGTEQTTKSEPDELTAELHDVFGCDVTQSPSSVEKALQKDMSSDIKEIFGCSADQVAAKVEEEEIRSVHGFKTGHGRTLLRSTSMKEESQSPSLHLPSASNRRKTLPSEYVTTCGTVRENAKEESQHEQPDTSASTLKPPT